MNDLSATTAVELRDFLARTKSQKPCVRIVVPRKHVAMVSLAAAAVAVGTAMAPAAEAAEASRPPDRQPMAAWPTTLGGPLELTVMGELVEEDEPPPTRRRR